MIHTHAFNRYVLALVLTLGGARSAISQVTPPTPPTTPGASSAQDTTLAKATSEAVAKTGDKLSVNYAVPEMPASAILGVTPATITRPITTKDFASSIIDGIDVDGHVRQGLAIETSLSMLRLSAFRVPLSKYQDSWWARFRSNLLLSFATVRVASDTQSTDIAWGVRAPIYDGGDPLAHREYTERLGQEMLQCAPATPIDGVPPGQQPGETVEEFLRRMNAAIATAATDTARRAKIAKRREEQLACLEKLPALGLLLGSEAADSLWNAARLIIAYAGSSRLGQSSIKSRSRLEDRIWIVGATRLWSKKGNNPLTRSSQLVGYADFVSKHAIDTIPSSKGASYGARVNLGSAKFNAFGELLGQWRDNPPLGAKRTTSASSGGIEFLAAPGMWISTGVGRRYSDIAQADKTVVLANIRWGISSKAFLGGDATTP